MEKKTFQLKTEEKTIILETFTAYCCCDANFQPNSSVFPKKKLFFSLSLPLLLLLFLLLLLLLSIYSFFLLVCVNDHCGSERLFLFEVNKKRAISFNVFFSADGQSNMLQPFNLNRCGGNRWWRTVSYAIG